MKERNESGDIDPQGPTKLDNARALLYMQYAKAARGNDWKRVVKDPKTWLKYVCNLEYNNSEADHIDGDSILGANAAGIYNMTDKN